MKPVDPALLRVSRPARRHLFVTFALAAVSAVVIVAQAALLAAAIATRSLAPLPWLAGVVALRAGLDFGFEVAGRRGAARVMSDLRGRLAEQFLVRRPDGLDTPATGELAALAQALNFNGVSIPQSQLKAFMQDLVEQLLNQQFNPAFFSTVVQDALERQQQAQPGYAVGTRGVHGRWFQNFGSGESVRLHHQEAVIAQGQERAFALDVLGGQQAGLDEDRLAQKIAVGVMSGTAALLAEERWKAGITQRDARQGAH